MSVSAISALTSSSNSSAPDQTSAVTHAQRKQAVRFKGDFAVAASDAFSKMATSAVTVSSNVAAALNTLKPII